MKNKYQLLFIVSALLIIGFFATTFFSYKIASNLARNDLKYKALPLSSDNVYSEIQRDLLKPNLVSSLMAQDTFLKQWIKNGEKNILAIQTYLGSIKNKYNTSSSFFVSEQTKNYYYPEGILKKISPSNERDIWFYRVKNIVDDYESNIDIDLASNDSLTIFTNYKMTDDEGNFLGVTGVGLQTSQVSDLLISYKKKYNHDIYFVNRDNKIILSSKQNFKKENGLKQDVINRLIQEFNKNEIPTLEYIYEKEKYILNIRYIDELHLYLFIEAKEQHFTKELKNTFYKNIAIFSVIIILIMTLIIFNINYYQRRLEYLAKTDKLTSLSNRNNFDIEFNKIFASERKSEKDLSLILFDIDNFKTVNDEFGHLVGDKVLVIVSEIFKTIFRKNDLIARWGGEEFIVLLANIPSSKTFELAEKLRISIYENQELKSLLSRPLSISLGIVHKKPLESKEEFFIRVDRKLYEAKKEGKNKTVR